MHEEIPLFLFHLLQFYLGTTFLTGEIQLHNITHPYSNRYQHLLYIFNLLVSSFNRLCAVHTLVSSCIVHNVSFCCIIFKQMLGNIKLVYSKQYNSILKLVLQLDEPWTTYTMGF